MLLFLLVRVKLQQLFHTYCEKQNIYANSKVVFTVINDIGESCSWNFIIFVFH